ncbi:MAG: cytochrome c [Betaproteobacteria bacterium]
MALGVAGVAHAVADPEQTLSRLNFTQHCSGCHARDGGGAPSKGVPSMRGALGDFLMLKGGREFIVQVPGVMNSPLGDGDIANLMNWLLPLVSAQTMPKDFVPYAASEIASLRQSRPNNIPAERKKLVLQARTMGLALGAEIAP